MTVKIKMSNGVGPKEIILGPVYLHYDDGDYIAWRDMPGHRHGKLCVARPCKKRADDLLKLSRHQLKMVVVILTDHVPVGGHVYTVGLFGGEPTCRFCRKETETVEHIICCCERLARQRYVFGNRLVEPKDISTACLSKGPVSLYKGHRVIECVLVGIFRVAQ
jgi:hypothetical protein